VVKGSRRTQLRRHQAAVAEPAHFFPIRVICVHLWLLSEFAEPVHFFPIRVI
jgi:hypothetical protein